MSDNDRRRPDDLLPDEERLHAVRDAVGDPEPPAEADLSVLRRARAALRDESATVRRAWTPRRLAAWTGTAAVAMLAVAIVLQQRAPDGMPPEPARTEPEPPAQVLHDAAEFRQQSTDAAAPRAELPPPRGPALQRADRADPPLENVQVTGSRISRAELEKLEAAEATGMDEAAAADADSQPPPRYAGVEPPPPPDEWRAALRAWQALGAQEVFLAELAAFQAAYPDEDTP